MSFLGGKVVLITGGSSGIGRAAALRFAKLGARVAIAARTAGALEAVAEEVRALGAEVLTLPVDVGDASQCHGMVTATVRRFGQLDVLINSAGISLRGPFEPTTPETTERVFRVNVLGTIYATQAAIPEVRKTCGSLIALSSLAGKRGAPSYAIYGASKFAICGLYEAIRIELADDRIHVGVVSPGFVDTPLRQNQLGPDGQPYAEPQKVPFEVWPPDRVVECILYLLRTRKAEVYLPWFVRYYIALDTFTHQVFSDRILRQRFREA
jgi:NAD(P)-dependent dehydrogenase (short-subunit alcohol dehydrogenase family)